MERHLAASTVSIGTRQESPRAGAPAARTNAFDTHPIGPTAASEPATVSSIRSVRLHTLVLTGELTHRSANALEIEIERLCEEGVNGITLDLRQLAYIDSIGVAVIAFRCGLCQRQGQSFALIPGSRLVQRAFEQAGMIGALPFQEDDIAARRLRSSSASQRAREGRGR